MKLKSLPIFVVLALAVTGLFLWQAPHRLPTARAQNEAKPKDDRRGILTTTGTATTRVQPDSARVFFRVESYAKEIKDARADNAKQVANIMKALADLKIDGLKMKSTDVNVKLVTRRERDDRRLPEILGYHVTYSFTVLTENDDAAELSKNASRILDAALENGATGVDQIRFFAKGVEAIRRELMTKAVQDALDNARALAAGAKRTIDEITTISGQPQFSATTNNFQQNTLFAPGGGEATPLVAGELVLSCSVSVSCKYDN